MACLIAALALAQAAPPNPPKFPLPANLPIGKDEQGLPNTPAVGEQVAVLETSKGRVVIEFLPSKAPNHVKNFQDLVSEKFYDGTRFHRCIKGFMVQGGDPNSLYLEKSSMWGRGGHTVNGAEVTLKAEFNDVHHVRGIVSMARAMDPDSASSQFFIVTDDATFLDGKYSAFGKVVLGMEVVDQIVLTGDPNDNGRVEPKDAVVLKSVKLATWPLKD